MAEIILTLIIPSPLITGSGDDDEIHVKVRVHFPVKPQQ